MSNIINKSMTRLINVFYNRSGHIDRDQVNLACSLLENGGVIAIPTDTIYGLAAKADDSKAINRIYEIKGRDLSKPLSVCLSHIDEFKLVTDQIIHPKVLLSLLPGPITVLMKRGQNLNKHLNPNIDSIGIRIANHNFITAIANIVGPLALTSANRSGETNPLEAQDFQELWPEVDCVFDAGLLQKRLDLDKPVDTRLLGSTVVDLTQPNTYKIIRPGCSMNRTINLLHRFGYRSRDKQTKEPLSSTSSSS